MLTFGAFQDQLRRYSLSAEEQDDGAGAATGRRVLVRREMT